MDLIFQWAAFGGLTSATCTGGVAALDHEVWDNAVEDDAVVVAASGQVKEVPACLNSVSPKVLGVHMRSYLWGVIMV